MYVTTEMAKWPKNQKEPSNSFTTQPQIDQSLCMVFILQNIVCLGTMVAHYVVDIGVKLRIHLDIDLTSNS